MVERWLESLASLLPTGFAWPRHPRSVVMRVLAAWAAALDALDARITQTVWQWMPHRTTLRLGEWEDACGLPDACCSATASEAERRSAVLARLRGGHPIDRMAAIHPSLQAVYHVPFRCGRDRAGTRLGRLDGRLRIHATVTATPMRCGQGRVGDRLRTYDPSEARLRCALGAVIPARFSFDFIFESAP